ncbi:tetratricopeptide repeat protein [Ferruginivarius sediminum]|uniref:Tetratricopeptide repeat protein n=1 Tax=Ferruginivarius sediminum TaxID=2661937 RepID=A0A369TDS4_9PROT|nr:tetratricopeptide repeat protein [Ferruginivarius sediminum]RDD63428.1 tetratricopeptide repeat protein [Ferruginivarius sediminum]
MTPTARAFVAAALLTLSASGAAADQNDPRLDTLFRQLGKVDTLFEAQRAEQRIWRIWHKHDDDKVTAAMATGQAALSEQNRKAALSSFDRAVKLAPNFAEAWNARATVNYLLGNYERSLADIRRVLALEPRHFGALSGRGLCLIALEKPRQALDAFEQSLKVHPFQPGTRQRAEQLRKLLDENAI